VSIEFVLTFSRLSNSPFDECEGSFDSDKGRQHIAGEPKAQGIWCRHPASHIQDAGWWCGDQALCEHENRRFAAKQICKELKLNPDPFTVILDHREIPNVWLLSFLRLSADSILKVVDVAKLLKIS
jgi:hypothetical protein